MRTQNIRPVTCNDMTFALNNTRTVFPCEELWVCTKILLGNPPVTVYKSLAFQSFAAPMQNSTGCNGLNGISIRSLFTSPTPLPPFQQFTRELLAPFLSTSFYSFSSILLFSPLFSCFHIPVLRSPINERL